ncbi:MAG: YggS family pyridoxal phosphate-dependent enzyme [Candidatus Cryptobacteroides sp.]
MSIAENIKQLKETLPQGTSLVAVSKFHPSTAIVEAYAAGQRVFAESRPQELLKKVQELPEADYPGLEWHFIGHLQTNKLKMVLPYVSLVQSVDSLRLLDEIQSWAAKNSRIVDVLLELHVAMEESKQGFYEEEIVELLFRAQTYRNIRFRGLMAMASNTDDFSIVEADFERADSLMAYLVDLFPELEDFNQLSTGMSHDWPLAVKHGSTMVRIGTAIFGGRAL